jgi:Fungal specific transcription factor domain
VRSGFLLICISFSLTALVLNFFAPTHVIRPEVVSAHQSAFLVKQYFQYALSHEILFESIVSLSQINLTANRTPDRDDISSTFEGKQPDRDALFHYGEALGKLRKLLSDKDAPMEDAVLFAIATLMGIDVSVQVLPRKSIKLVLIDLVYSISSTA